MVFGQHLSQNQVHNAIGYNSRRFRDDADFLRIVRRHLGLPTEGAIDEGFVRHVATWQETNIGTGQGDGWVGTTTEAHLNILLPEATRAVAAAESMLLTENILFDSWSNDMRDNNLDGVVDDPDERTPDGSHFGRNYQMFNVRRGSYEGGWNLPQHGYPRRRVTVTQDRSVQATFRYAVCADVASEAYARARVMGRTRSTGRILRVFRSKGYVWCRRDGYPSEYVPGDFICTWAPGGGHSGIVVNRGPTNGGALVPIVIELPGPSSQVSDGTYDPANRTDVVRHPWSSFRLTAVGDEHQYLGRLLHTRLR